MRSALSLCGDSLVQLNLGARRVTVVIDLQQLRAREELDEDV